MGAAVEGERELEDVFEIVGQHRLAAAVREPVRVQCDQHAARDDEQSEGDPGGEQWSENREVRRFCRGLGAHQRVDDPAEQDRFGKLRGCKSHVGDGENPAEPRLGAEQAENAGVKLEEIHWEDRVGRRTLTKVRVPRNRASRAAMADRDQGSA